MNTLCYTTKCPSIVKLYRTYFTRKLKNPLENIKSNHFYCHITTAQVPWWVKFLWACSRQCRKTTDNLHMDRQCKKNNKQFTYGQTVQKNNKQFTYGQTVQKKQQTIYIWTDSAKKTTNNLHMDRQCKKLHWSIYSAPDSAKKQQQQFTYGQTVQKSNSNLHMDSTYQGNTWWIRLPGFALWKGKCFCFFLSDMRLIKGGKKRELALNEKAEPNLETRMS